MADQKPFDKRWPFVDLGVKPNTNSGSQKICDCPFCGKGNKFYINEDTGQWDCKVCGESGNAISFLSKFYEELTSDPPKKQLKELAENRGFTTKQILSLKPRFWDEKERWVIPVFNAEGKISTLRFYAIGKKTYAPTGTSLALGGLEHLNDKGKEICFLVEGEWDYLAMSVMLEEADEEGCVLWVPGAEVFKKNWEEYFIGKKVILCYDHDLAGERGKQKVALSLSKYVPDKDLFHIAWDAALTKGFDVRDFFQKYDGDFSELQEYIERYQLASSGTKEYADAQSKFPHISERTIVWEEVLDVFRKHFQMPVEMEWALKSMCAIVMSLNIRDTSPSWMHIIGPPGCGKTELIMAFGSCENVEIISSTTPRALVSGFALPGGKDPSLIRRIIGKCLMIKDYTEHIQMNRQDKEEIEAILRGAYDGVVTKQFGNGILRHYENCRFNIVTGVTPELFREVNGSMGERFLNFHMVKGNNYNDVDGILLKSASKTGHETSVKEELQSTIKKFVEVGFTLEELPELNDECKDFLSALSQVVSYLRVSVARSYRNPDDIIYRPQREYGTRPMNSLNLLMRILAMCNKDFEQSEDNYQIIARAAISSCKPLHFEVAEYLFANPDAEKRDIAEAMSLRTSNLDIILDDMCQVEFFTRRRDEDHDGPGQPPYRYSLSKTAYKLWKRARLSTLENISAPKPRQRMRFVKGKK